MRLTLTAARTKRGLSHDELAERAGVSRATVYRLEGGYIDNPNSATVEKLESALGVKPGTLFFPTRAPEAEEAQAS
jgi:transcriptional regulator with XRE-family HTH domain